MTKKRAVALPTRIQVAPNAASIESVKISRAGVDESELLRAFFAQVDILPDDMPESVRAGYVHGYIAFNCYGDELTDAADEIGSDELTLFSAADEICAELEDDPEALEPVSHVVGVGMLRLDPKWRGNRLTKVIIDDLLDVLRLDSCQTLVVMQPEPQLEEGGQMDPGADRDRAMRRLHAAYREAGFEPWVKGKVWFRHPGRAVSD